MSNESDSYSKILKDAAFHFSNPGNTKNALAELLYRPEVRGLYYNGQDINLDGYTFIGCRFDNCRLHVASTNFQLLNCVIDPQSTIIYGTEVIKIIRLWNSRHEWADTHFPGFVPTRNANGTITIADHVV